MKKIKKTGKGCTHTKLKLLGTPGTTQVWTAQVRGREFFRYSTINVFSLTNTIFLSLTYFIVRIQNYRIHIRYKIRVNGKYSVSMASGQHEAISKVFEKSEAVCGFSVAREVGAPNPCVAQGSNVYQRVQCQLLKFSYMHI